MSTYDSRSSLRSILLLDAVTCAGMGLVFILGAGFMSGFTGIPKTLLFYAGLSLFPIATFMAAIGYRKPISATGAWLVIIGNAAWVAASLWLIVSGWIEPNLYGTVLIFAQALVVAILAWLEFSALRNNYPAESASYAIRTEFDS